MNNNEIKHIFYVCKKKNKLLEVVLRVKLLLLIYAFSIGTQYAHFLV